MNEIIITNHPLAHIPELKVDPDMLTVRFARGCSISKCSAACCNGGVWVDVIEQSNILLHEKLIREYMEPEMEKNSDAWFDGEYINDTDFVSGKAVGTAVNESGCVFLTGTKLCLLQKIEITESDPSLKLKPFYCKTFPIAIQTGRVIFDQYMGNDQPQCCSPLSHGELTVFDLCAEELELVLGKEGLNDLRKKI